MSLHFLCPTHRDWVYFHPKEAWEQIQVAQRQGEALLVRGEFQQALSFLGSAFETVEILIELQGERSIFLHDRLTALTFLLVECFEELDAPGYRSILLKQVINTLKHARDSESANSFTVARLTRDIQTLDGLDTAEVKPSVRSDWPQPQPPLH